METFDDPSSGDVLGTSKLRTSDSHRGVLFCGIGKVTLSSSGCFSGVVAVVE